MAAAGRWGVLLVVAGLLLLTLQYKQQQRWPWSTGVRWVWAAAAVRHGGLQRLVSCARAEVAGHCRRVYFC
jgi:hypothetical protein